MNHPSGLPATGAGMAELQTLLKSSLFDLMCDDLDPPPKERPPPKPESVRAMEGLKRRIAEGRTIPKRRRQMRIPDDEL